MLDTKIQILVFISLFVLAFTVRGRGYDVLISDQIRSDHRSNQHSFHFHGHMHAHQLVIIIVIIGVGDEYIMYKCYLNKHLQTVLNRWIQNVWVDFQQKALLARVIIGLLMN